MDIDTLLMFPGVKSALLVLLGSGIMSAVAAYRESLVYPAIQEFKKVRAEFEEMISDGKLDKAESAQIAEYATGLFKRVSNKLKA